MATYIPDTRELILRLVDEIVNTALSGDCGNYDPEQITCIQEARVWLAETQNSAVIHERDHLPEGSY